MFEIKRFVVSVELGDSFLDFLNKIFLFVKIKSIKRGFSDCKQVGVFTKFSVLNNGMKSARYLLQVVKLKSPSRIICLYLER